jgi:hypothetical protein
MKHIITQKEHEAQSREILKIINGLEYKTLTENEMSNCTKYTKLVKELTELENNFSQYSNLGCYNDNQQINPKQALICNINIIKRQITEYRVTIKTEILVDKYTEKVDEYLR